MVNLKNGVPDAPFKTSWHEMMFRRLVRMAAEEGKDWLGWTTGEQQAERYDLSKSIKREIWPTTTAGATAHGAYANKDGQTGV